MVVKLMQQLQAKHRLTIILLLRLLYACKRLKFMSLILTTTEQSWERVLEQDQITTKLFLSCQWVHDSTSTNAFHQIGNMTEGTLALAHRAMLKITSYFPEMKPLNKFNGKFLMNILESFFILITNFNIFIVPNRIICWHFANVLLMSVMSNFSIFFCKSDVTSPVAPKTSGTISNETLGYNCFNSDDNCMQLSWFRSTLFVMLISRSSAISILKHVLPCLFQ